MSTPGLSVLHYPSLPWASQVALVVKNVPANAEDVRDVGLIPGSGRSPGEGHGSPLQYSCLENPMERGAWTTVHGDTELDVTEMTSDSTAHRSPELSHSLTESLYHSTKISPFPHPPNP